jgi:CubicO group peptidase (beta-lactamase class C family)
MTSTFAPPIAVAELERDARMKRLHRLLAALSILYLVTLGLATAARAYDAAPVSDPEALGFSPSRLARIAAWQQSQVDAGAFSGAVAAIARNGRIAYLRAVGFRDRAKMIPLQPDAIFWIASMTKPVTSVAAMMLVEEGKLDLAAPVRQYLPELKDMMVAVETKDPVTGKTDLAREPQKHPMTVEDLLRHTAGLVYGVSGTKVDQLYKSLYGTTGVYRRDKTLADFVSGLAKLPLAHQPGEAWEYGLADDVLARVIEVASGQPFDQFLETRLFQPLDMVDTGFHVPEAKLSRLVDPPAGGWGGPLDGAGGRHQANQTVLRRWWIGVDGRRLSAVLSDAAQRRRARRSPHPFARNCAADDHELAAARHPLRRLCKRHRRAPGWLDVGARLRDPQRCGVEHGAWVGWQLHLDGRLGHLFLG